MNASQEDRFFYEIPNTAGDNIEAHWYLDGRTKGGGSFSISIEEPWAGSTETGFGANTHISLPAKAAIELANFILANAPKPP